MSANREGFSLAGFRLPSPGNLDPFEQDAEKTSTEAVAYNKFAPLPKLPPSPAESNPLKHNMNGARESSEEEDEMPEGWEHNNNIWNPLDRGAPGDEAIFAENMSPSQREINKKRAKYYEKVFAAREPLDTARKLVSDESLVHADVRTNILLDDEFTFISSLSHALAQAYERPESSVLVTLTHSACLMFAGTFEPAYTLTVNAISQSIKPRTNIRMAMILQNEMQELLGVSATRGMVRFVPIPEENLAYDNNTVFGMIQDLQKGTKNDTTIRRDRTGDKEAEKSKKSQRRESMMSIKSVFKAKNKEKLLAQEERPDTSLSGGADSEESSVPSMPVLDRNVSLQERVAEEIVKSDVKSNGRSDVRFQDRVVRSDARDTLDAKDRPDVRQDSSPDASSLSSAPPPIPFNKSALDKRAQQAQKVTRRKSFIQTLFGK